jgi:hypothetical protein
MTKAYPKAGYKGKVEINGVKIGGAVEWAYSGSTRNMIPADEFGEEIISHVPGQIEGGDITMNGNCLISQDEGQQLLETLFRSGDQITNVKLYISSDDGIYYIPDDTTEPPSFATVTVHDAITHNRSGTAQFNATLKLSGVLTIVYT